MRSDLPPLPRPPETRHTKAALYNCGLAYQGEKDWTNAIARLQLVEAEPADRGEKKGSE